MPSFPPSLPDRPFTGTMTETPADNSVGFKPSIGEVIKRRRGTTDVDKIDFAFPPISAAQKTTLRSFFKVDCAYGSLRFDHIDFDDGVTAAVYKWLAPPQFVHAGVDSYRATCSWARLS